nr:hypothetical protein [Brevibacterium album]
MCRAVACKMCGKTTWAGCGQHVDSVKQTVPAGQWCGGHQAEPRRSDGEPRRSGGFLATLFGRR